MKNPFDLNQVLVVTTRKGVWGSAPMEVFPNQLLTRKLRQDLHSTHWLNSIGLFLQCLLWVWMRKPAVILVGTAVTVGVWLRKFKSWGLVPAKLVLHNRHYRPITSGAADLVIHDSTHEVEVYGKEDDPHKHVYVPYCMEYWKEPEPDVSLPDGVQEPFFLSTGSAGRDYSVLDRASSGAAIQGVVTAQLRDSVTERYVFGDHIQSYYNLPEDIFQKLLRSCSFVVVGLKRDPYHMGGGSTVLKALQHGKPIITEPYHRDYVTHQHSGLLINTSDESELKQAIHTLCSHPELLKTYSENALQDGRGFSYQRFVDDLQPLLRQVAVREP
ncbi:MAG: glycosyltransferase [Verrucomicrobiota bacterium]